MGARYESRRVTGVDWHLAVRVLAADFLRPFAPMLARLAPDSSSPRTSNAVGRVRWVPSPAA